MKDDRIPKSPPVWAQRFLKWRCPEDSLEEVEGDLSELYHYWFATVGKREADKRYIMNAIRLQRPFKSRSEKVPHSTVNLNTMINHYGRVAFRNLTRNKSFSVINISGLALGLACTLLIFLWIKDELSVDDFHVNGNQLFRVYVTHGFAGEMANGYNSPALLPAELKKVIPEIEYATGFVKYFRLSLQDDIYETFEVDDKIHKMKGGRAEEDFFKMFSYPLLYGSAETALKSPESLCMSRKMAEIFFGSPEQAMGKIVRFDGRKDVMVTAVFENVPVNSTDQFDYLMNWDAWVAENPFKQSWGHFGTSTYVQLRADANPVAVGAKIKGFMKNYGTAYERSGYPPEYKIELGLQRFSDQYLYSTFENGKPLTGRIEYVRLFSGIGIFILVIACINFMNLATARSVKRAKEVGIRKVVGSSRWYLIFQFMSEAIALTGLSALIAIAITGLALPAFNLLTGKEMSLPFADPGFCMGLLGLILITGIIAGSYPAFLLSSFQPVKILKGALTFHPGTIHFRKGLVVFQFVLSLVLLIATLVITRQTYFIRHTNLGYDRENLIYVPLEGELIRKYEAFRQEASTMPGIKFVDRCSQFPHTMGFRALAVEWPGKSPDKEILFNMASVGYDFVKVMDLQVVEGRGFSREIRTDSMSFLVNEEAVRQMELQDPVGKEVTIWGSLKGKIIGVLKDYHTSSLHERIDPMILDIKEDLNFGTIIVRTEAGKTREALESLKAVYGKVNPDFPFQYSFVDQQYGKLYKSEEVVSKLSNVFAALAIAISCMGLLGLAMFSAEQRRKELSIRKVLGATISNIVVKFSKDFLKLVLLALIISVPISWVAMSSWLNGFAYKIDLAWWMFAAAGVTAVLISMLTISAQAVRSALENPLKNLRSE
jgi:ABC-type antimicrobial peptide transport system permease subunit